MKVAIARDSRFLKHLTGHGHPEHPARLRSVYKMVDENFKSKLIVIEPEPIALENLELVHTQMYIQKVLKTADHDFTSLAPDTPASSQTYLAAWLAAGACLTCLHALMANECDAGFALVRPPGHHALPDRAGGFCVLNNLAIAARYAIARQGFSRVLIVDWDIHHGNGIQDVFYQESKVFYFSTHDVLLYPYTGHSRETGKGEGLGYNLNIPLPRQAKDSDMAHLYREILDRLVGRLKPDLILVSAGFDGHRRDPIGRSLWSEDAFRQLTRCLLHACGQIGQVPVLFALEGGYEPVSLANCVHSVIKELLDGDPDTKPPGHRSRLAEDLIRKARTRHASYGIWTD